jgi:hypothetical protein
MATGLMAEYLQNKALQEKFVLARQAVTTTQAGAASADADLATARQMNTMLQAENARQNAQIASLTNQVNTLNSQVVSLTAQLPPPPVSCTADPGVRANVNQTSLQVVGESTTQALINYLCQNGILTPSAIRNFFNVHSMSYLRQNFGYG